MKLPILSIALITMAVGAQADIYRGHPALRIDSCLKTSECDRNNKVPGDWHVDIIPIPEGEVCTPQAAIDEGIKWLEKNRPDSWWAGSGCIFVQGAEL